VKNAVITVPAYFNDSQRQATKVSVFVGLGQKSDNCVPLLTCHNRRVPVGTMCCFKMKIVVFSYQLNLDPSGIILLMIRCKSHNLRFDTVSSL
jgi:hypothetical protein